MSSPQSRRNTLFSLALGLQTKVLATNSWNESNAFSNFFLLKWIFYDCKCSVYRWTKETFTNLTLLSAGSDSLYLQFKPTIWAQSYPRKRTNFTTPLEERHFPKPLRHAEKQQLYWNWATFPLQSSSLQPPKFNVHKPTWWLGYKLLALIENLPQNIKK